MNKTHVSKMIKNMERPSNDDQQLVLSQVCTHGIIIVTQRH